MLPPHPCRIFLYTDAAAVLRCAARRPPCKPSSSTNPPSRPRFQPASPSTAAQRLCHSLPEQPIESARTPHPTAGTAPPITISASFGIADTRSAGYELRKLLTQADAAMYTAKRKGRDRVKTFEEVAAT